MLEDFVFPTILEDIVLEGSDGGLEIADFELVVALDLVEHLQPNGIVIDERSNFVFQLLILPLIVRELFFKFFQHRDIPPLDPLPLDPILILLPLGYPNLMPQLLYLVLLPVDDLKLGLKIVCMVAHLLLRQSLFVLSSCSCVLSLWLSRCSRSISRAFIEEIIITEKGGGRGEGREGLKY
jgi:hypothetical protein